ncbi:MAG: single-stranded DNA-binding protein [Nevskia sp.]|nr:single-stranded DNA-binding protein [Nevskia sp.]
MTGLNRIVLLGTLAQEPEIRYTASGDASANFTLGVERSHGGEGKAATDYVRVVARRHLAERCAGQLQPGDLVTVEGRLHTSSYETREGFRRKTVEVEALQVELVAAGRRAASPADGPEAGGARFQVPGGNQAPF